MKKKTYGKKNDLALDTWVKLARASSSFNKKTSEDIRSYGLTVPQFGVLDALGHLGPMTIGHLCDKMLVSGGNMTLVLDNLEKNELIERIKNPEDRRAINVQLTDKGLELFDEIFAKHAERVGELMSVLTKDEQTQLGNLLKKLGSGVKER